MARTDTLPHFLTDVANAIRTAEGSSGTITASDFDTRIEALSGSGEETEYEMRKSDMLPKLTLFYIPLSEKNYTSAEVQKVDALITLYSELYEGGNE